MAQAVDIFPHGRLTRLEGLVIIMGADDLALQGAKHRWPWYDLVIL